MDVLAVVVAVLLGLEIGGLTHQYRKEQAKNREAEAEHNRLLRKEIECAAYNITEDLKALNVNLTKVAIGALDTANELGPLMESLAESLTQRMSTIDGDMADLRTRVERATGTSTLSL